ncbi:LysR family transcriptional regulator [Pseudomonas moorei]|nr:LysR family transcriptional regulator [Pseudomonas moorei]
MEIRHFRYFLKVAQHRNFTRAAEQLGIATPTLSRQIQDLEQALGTRLFVRQQREVALTEAGEVLLKEAESAVHQFEFAQRSAKRAARGDIGHIEMGYVASAVFSGVLQKQIQSFSLTNPDVTVSMCESPMQSLPGMVADGRFDVGYVRVPMCLPEGVASVLLDEEGFVLAMPYNSWLSALPEIRAEHLQNEMFILPEQISGTLQVAADGMFSPTLGPQPGGLLSVIALVSLGQGVAVVPQSMVGHLKLPSVVYRSITGGAGSSWLAMIYRRFEKAPAVMRYISQVKAMYSKKT